MIGDTAYDAPQQDLQAPGTVVLVMHYDYSQTGPLGVFRTLTDAYEWSGTSDVALEEYNLDTGQCVAAWHLEPANDAWRQQAGWVRHER